MYFIWIKCEFVWSSYQQSTNKWIVTIAWVCDKNNIISWEDMRGSDLEWIRYLLLTKVKSCKAYIASIGFLSHHVKIAHKIIQSYNYIARNGGVSGLLGWCLLACLLYQMYIVNQCKFPLPSCVRVHVLRFFKERPLFNKYPPFEWVPTPLGQNTK